MDTNRSIDLEADALIRQIDANELSRDAIVMLAKGLFPLAADDLVRVLLHLSASEDKEVAILSKGAIEDFPVDVLNSFAHESRSSDDLERLALAARDRSVLEEIIRNRATLDETILRLAAEAKGSLQEVIVINQARVLRKPEILDALLANPNLLPDVRRRALETREEFFDKRSAREASAKLAREADAQGKAEETAESEDDAVLSPDEEAVLKEMLEEAKEEDDSEGPTLDPPKSLEDAKEKSIWNRILLMGVSEKVQCAFKAGRTERGILIRDRNKLVCTAVIRSPRISETEVESFAGMRNIEGEVLRLIGSNREWMGKYPIMLALVRNPKAPIGVVLPMVPRLNNRDLRSLSIDKNVAEAVRKTAKRIFVDRTQGRSKR